MINIPQPKKLFTIKRMLSNILIIHYSSNFVVNWFEEYGKQFGNSSYIDGSIWFSVNSCYDVDDVILFIESNCKLNDQLFENAVVSENILND